MVMVKEAQAKYLTIGKEEQSLLEKGACPDGYKLTKVGVIPDDWKIKQLCKVATLQRGFDLPTKILKKGKYPVVYSNGISNYHEKYMVKGIGVITGRSGTIGKVHYVEDNYWPHNTSLWVTNFHGNNEKFIYYLYSSLKLEQFCTGSGVPTLNRNDVHDLTVVLPSVKEQELIAKALSDVDTLITALAKLIAKKQAIKTATMQQLLTGKKRLPGFGEGKGYKQTELGEIPEDWKVKPYGDVFGFIPTANNSRDDLSQNDEIMYIHYGDIHTKWDFNLNLEKYELPRIAREKFKSAKFLKEGDLVMADASEDYEGIGKSVEIKNIGDKLVISGLHTFLLRDRDETYVNGFKAYLHSIQAVKDIFDKLATGLKVYGLSKNNLKKVFIPVPSKDEQIAVVDILDTMADEIVLLQNRLSKTQQIKQGMMQELLTGKTRLI